MNDDTPPDDIGGACCCTHDEFPEGAAECGADVGVFGCTRPDGHGGRHVACGHSHDLDPRHPGDDRKEPEGDE